MECDVFRDQMMDVLYGEADAATVKRWRGHEGRCLAWRGGVSGSPRGTAVVREQEIVERVQRMIQESESRQAVLLNASLGRLRNETQAQRRYDLAQVGAGLSYLEGQTGLQMARQTELMGHVLQV